MAAKSKSVKAAKDSPALVNSSQLVFFCVSAVVWARYLSHQFPAVLQSRAFLMCLLIPAVITLFFFLLNQFLDSTSILNTVVVYFCVMAVMPSASAIKGPLADGTVTLFCAQISAGALEFAYNLFAFALPSGAKRALATIDNEIDSLWDREMWKLFDEKTWRGVLAVSILLAMYAAVYFVILIGFRR